MLRRAYINGVVIGALGLMGCSDDDSIPEVVDTTGDAGSNSTASSETTSSSASTDTVASSHGEDDTSTEANPTSTSTTEATSVPGATSDSEADSTSTSTTEATSVPGATSDSETATSDSSSSSSPSTTSSSPIDSADTSVASETSSEGAVDTSSTPTSEMMTETTAEPDTSTVVVLTESSESGSTSAETSLDLPTIVIPPSDADAGADAGFGEPDAATSEPPDEPDAATTDVATDESSMMIDAGAASDGGGEEVSCVLTGTCVCGDNVVEGTEACDDGNQLADDGCRADCTGFEECGDGIVDSATGEECDDGNTDDGDGCSSSCQLPPYADRAAVMISDTLSCTTATENTGRKTAADGGGNLYVLMRCAGALYVSRSEDQGATWSLPIDTTLTDISEAAIEGGAAGFAYVVAVNTVGDLVFSRSLDSGDSWEMPRTLASGVTATLGLDSMGDSVYISAPTSSSALRVFRNTNLGTGEFDAVDVAINNVYSDLAVDKITGNVVVMTDDPNFYIRVSSDMGNTFGPVSAPPGAAYYSDWTGSNGNLYVTGGQTSLYVIPMSDPSTSTSISGLPEAGFAPRSIDADALGNAYIATTTGSGIQLDRLILGASSVDSGSTVIVSPTGSLASVAALPNNSGALVAYTDGTSVWAAIEAY